MMVSRISHQRKRERFKAIIYVYLRVSYSTPSRDRIVSVGVWLCTLSHGQTCEGVCVCAQLQPHGQQPRKRSLTIPFRPRENGSPNCSSSSSEISTKLCTMRWTLRLSRRGLPFYRGLVVYRVRNALEMRVWRGCSRRLIENNCGMEDKSGRKVRRKDDFYRRTMGKFGLAPSLQCVDSSIFDC